MQIKQEQQPKAGIKIGCILLCGQPLHKFKKTFRDLIIEGINLTTLAKLTESEEYRFDKEILRPTHLDNLLNSLHQRFFQWRCQIRNLLNIIKIDEPDRLIFYHSGNDTPESIPGLSYEKNKDKFLKVTETIKNDIKANITNLENLAKVKIKKSNLLKDSQIISLDIIPFQNGTKMQIAINADTDKLLEADWQRSHYWKLIYKLAKKEFVETKDYQSDIENLNTNKTLKLYTKTGLGITKFLEDNNGYVKSKIPIRLQTKKWLTQNLKSGQFT